MTFSAKPLFKRDGIMFSLVESSRVKFYLQIRRKYLKKTSGKKVAIMSKDNVYYLYLAV